MKSNTRGEDGSLRALTRPKWKTELIERRFVLVVVGGRRGLSSEVRFELGPLELEEMEGLLEWEGSLDGDIVAVSR